MKRNYLGVVTDNVYEQRVRQYNEEVYRYKVLVVYIIMLLEESLNCRTK